MNVQVKWHNKMTFLGVSGQNHVTVMDTSPDHGGDGTAPSPMELVLMGLAGCSGVDIISILNKKRIAFDTLDMEISAERAADHPKVFTEVTVDYIFSGKDLSPKPLEDAVRLSVEKYCSVAGMVSKTANLNWNVVIR